jgi:hypothetical protein
MIDVPTTLDAVLDPGWLRHALDDVGRDNRIIEVDEIDSSQTLAQKVRFLVTVERADGARRHRHGTMRGSSTRSASRTVTSCG